MLHPMSCSTLCSVHVGVYTDPSVLDYPSIFAP